MFCVLPVFRCIKPSRFTPIECAGVASGTEAPLLEDQLSHPMSSAPIARDASIRESSSSSSSSSSI